MATIGPINAVNAVNAVSAVGDVVVADIVVDVVSDVVDVSSAVFVQRATDCAATEGSCE